MNNIILLLLLCSFFIMCSKDEGVFSFKKGHDDRFIRIEDPCEFDQDEIVQWSFCFPKVSSSKKIGVIIEKKEIVWVDVYSFYDTINKEKKCIFGTIENYDIGTYRITIISDGIKISEKEFTIYSDNE